MHFSSILRPIYKRKKAFLGKVLAKFKLHFCISQFLFGENQIKYLTKKYLALLLFLLPIE